MNEDLAMNSAFNKLRSIDDLDEVIYAQEYDNSINTSDWLPSYSCSSNATTVFGTYSIMERVYGPTDRFLNVYSPNDLRIQPNQFSTGNIQILIQEKMVFKYSRMLVLF